MSIQRVVIQEARAIVRGEDHVIPLKPCPRCGAPGQFIVWNDDDYDAGCPACGLVLAGYSSRLYLAQEWNALEASAVSDLRLTGRDLREDLALYAHTAWSGWLEYMFAKAGTDLPTGGISLEASYCSRWRRQMTTHYQALPENEKLSDRAEADKILRIIFLSYWQSVRREDNDE